MTSGADKTPTDLMVYGILQFFVGSFWLDFVLTEAVFWIPVMKYGNNFANNYRGALIGYVQNCPWLWLFLSLFHLSCAHPCILFSGKYYLQFVHSQKCPESKMRQVRLMCLHINQQYRSNVLDWSWQLICLMDTCIKMWPFIQGEYKMKVVVSLLTLMMLTAGLRTVGL